MKVKELLDSPEKWTKGALSRNSVDRRVPVGDTAGVCWCLVGAIHMCYGRYPKSISERIKNRIERDSVVEWNDARERTFEDIRKLVEELDI